jgi:hypothetical protein
MQREYFPRIRKTVVPRPVVKPETDVLGQSGSVRASEAAIYGPNWYHDHDQDLIEIWDAGAALCFRDVLPKKEKYAREGLYLRLSLAYRTTEGAFANIRTFSGNHVTLPNAVGGGMYDDPHTFHWVTEDCTLNVNSIYRDQRLWLQRVDWEWMSRETLFEDEAAAADPYLARTPEQIEALYAERPLDDAAVLDLLAEQMRRNSRLARQFLLLAGGDGLGGDGLATLYTRLNLRAS